MDEGGNHRFEKRLYWHIPLLEKLWVGMPDSFLLLVCLSVFFFYFLLHENRVMIILLLPEENMGKEKKTNGCANQVDEEPNWSKNFLAH